MRSFEYIRPPTLEDAISILARGARALAGGTDLITLMKADIDAPERLVSLRGLLPGGIRSAPDGTSIGAATLLSDIEAHEIIRSRYAALAQAAAAAASLQLRNMATLGGNLLQRPRCWYFRNRDIDCWLKGGPSCPAREGRNREHALFGGNYCVAVHPSDLAPALLAFDAVLTVAAPPGQRTLTLDQLYALPQPERRTETTLERHDVIVNVRLPPPAPRTRSVYLKAMDRKAFAFALAGVAALIRASDDGARVAHARIVLSGVAPVPWRAEAAEALLIGAQPTPDLLERAADAALAGAMPLRENRWKLPLQRALITRALEQLVPQAGH
jgi:xanthine dehydrogenase YagS FAD-binding subunit